MKPIEFSDYAAGGHRSIESDLLSRVNVYSQGNAIAINATHAEVRFDDPRILDGLADAIKRAAEALRKSKQVTFGDLQVGDWFETRAHPGRCMKIDAARYSALGRDHENKPGCWCMMHLSGQEPVIRLTATFTPSDAAVDK